MQINGLVETSKTQIAYFSTSLNIKHIDLNGTKLVSLFVLRLTTEQAFQSIRISGTIVGDSKQDISSGYYATFLCCIAISGAYFTLQDVEIYGAQINHTGVDAVLENSAQMYVNNLLVTRLVNNLNLMH